MTCPTCGGEQHERLVRVRPAAVVALYVVGLGLAWWLTGALLHDLVEGLDRTRLPLWKLAVPLAVLIGAAVLALRRRRRGVCPRCGAGVLLVAGSGPPAPERRRFLRVIGVGGAAAASAAAGGVAAVARNRGWISVARDFVQTQVETTSPSPRPEWAEARIRSYRRLGRTNALVSDISVGSGHIGDPEIAIRAIERGVTYFDTSPDYADAGSEQVLGQAFKGRRDKLFIATKFCRPEGHLLNETPVPDIMTAVEASLRRLQTDHVDLIHIHSCDRVERLMAPNIHEAFDRLKEQGKVRFLGVSTHTPNLEEVANAAIDSGRFDVMMLAYHFGMWKSFGHLLEKAKQHDVGIVAMKTLKGAKHTNLAQFRDEAGAYSQAAFRWVLSNPQVSCLVVSFSQLQHCDEYIAASGTAPQPSDVTLLRRYDTLTAGDYCQPHCGVCLDACPEDLPINDVLRYRMYFRDYGWEKEGMRLFAQLERDASVCAGCPAPCAGSCPIGVPIREKMLDARRVLSFPG
jgi:aryl-alcohol dehydrogenase-like predicted oxidoreductase